MRPPGSGDGAGSHRHRRRLALVFQLMEVDSRWPPARTSHGHGTAGPPSKRNGPSAGRTAQAQTRPWCSTDLTVSPGVIPGPSRRIHRFWSLAIHKATSACWRRLSARFAAFCQIRSGKAGPLKQGTPCKNGRNVMFQSQQGVTAWHRQATSNGSSRNSQCSLFWLLRQGQRIRCGAERIPGRWPRFGSHSALLAPCVG